MALLPERQHVLDDKVRNLLPILVDTVFPNGGVFVGGTALAEYYLGHRLSDDIDIFFYAAEDVQPVSEGFSSACIAAGMVVEKTKSARGWARLFIDGVKVEFVGDETLEDSDKVMTSDGVVLATPECIAGMKWKAISGRGAVKDLYDLWKLEGHVNLEKAIRLSERKNFSVNDATRAWGLNEAMKQICDEPPGWHLDPERWPEERKEISVFVEKWMDKFLGRSYFEL